MISISGAVRSITAALDTFRKCRERRIGRITSKEFWDRLVQINKQVKAAVDEEHAGPLRAQKALWFNYKILTDEIANIAAILNVAEQLLDENVLEEIQNKGYDANKVARLIEEGKKMLTRIRNDVALHEDTLAKKIAGVQVSNDSLNQIEYRITGSLHGLEDSIQKHIPEAISKVTSHPDYRSEGISRRGFLSKFIKSAAAALALSTAGSISNLVYAQETKTPEITEQEIAELMKKETVEEILQGANVEFVKYNPITKTTNYDELVFQKHLKPEERKPVLVLFYHNKDPTTPNKPEAFSQRNAIIFRKISEQFAGTVKFVCYDADSDPVMAANNYDGFNKRLNILGIPSIAMYSPFDVAMGEKPNNNDGIIKRIDTLRGGPGLNKSVPIIVRNSTNYWVKPNLLNLPNPDNDGKIYRYNNTFKLSEIAKLAKQ